MSVTVREAALLKEWRQGGREFLEVLFRPQTAQAGDLDSARAAWSSVISRHGTGKFGLLEPVPTARGPAFLVTYCDDREDLRALLRELGAELERHSLTGALAPYPNEYAAMDDPVSLREMFTLGIALSGRQGQDPGAWEIEGPARGRLLDHALGWCHLAGAEHFVRINMIQHRVAPDERAGILRGLELPNASYTLLCVDGNQRFRRVVVTGDGHALYSEGGTELPLPWQDHLLQFRRLAVALSDVAQYGLIRRNQLPPIDWALMFREGWEPSPRLEMAVLPQLRVLERTLVPDAFGVQLLTAGHLARLPARLVSWRKEELPNGTVLLRQENEDAWFGSSEPAPGVLAAARESLAGLLLSNDDRPGAAHPH